MAASAAAAAAAGGRVGFIGLGIMGWGMAKNLASKPDPRSLVVWNRSTSKSEAFKAEFASTEIASSPKEVVESCDLTYLIISDLAASKAVYEGEDGVLAGVSGGKKLVDCATLTPEHMQSLSNRVSEKGGLFLEAPVSGSKGPAEQGTLIFLAAGAKGVFDEAQSDFEAMGKANFFFGDVGQGSRCKLVVNMVMGGMMSTLCEGMALAEGAELPMEDVLKVFDLGAMSNPMFRMKGPKMAAGDYAPNFPLKHAQKDMRFAINLGDDLGVSLPVCAASNESFKRARPEHGDEDFSAVYTACQKPKKG